MDSRITVAVPSGAVRFGDLVFTSGQLGVRADGSHMAGAALGNMPTALRAAGAEPADVLKVTAYIVGVEHWPRFNAVYAEIMGDARPARTVVPVPELHYGYLVEVDAVATCRGSNT